MAAPWKLSLLTIHRSQWSNITTNTVSQWRKPERNIYTYQKLPRDRTSEEIKEKYQEKQMWVIGRDTFSQKKILFFIQCLIKTQGEVFWQLGPPPRKKMSSDHSRLKMVWVQIQRGPSSAVKKKKKKEWKILSHKSKFTLRDVTDVTWGTFLHSKQRTTTMYTWISVVSPSHMLVTGWPTSPCWSRRWWCWDWSVLLFPADLLPDCSRSSSYKRGGSVITEQTWLLLTETEERGLLLLLLRTSFGGRERSKEVLQTPGWGGEAESVASDWWTQRDVVIFFLYLPKTHEPHLNRSV